MFIINFEGFSECACDGEQMATSLLFLPVGLMCPFPNPLFNLPQFVVLIVWTFP